MNEVISFSKVKITEYDLPYFFFIASQINIDIDKKYTALNGRFYKFEHT